VADPLVGKARAGDLENGFLRNVSKMSDMLCSVTDAEDFESGAVAEIEGGRGGFAEDEESEDWSEQD